MMKREGIVETIGGHVVKVFMEGEGAEVTSV